MARKARKKSISKPNAPLPFVPNQSLDAAAQVIRDSAARQRQHFLVATSQPQGSPLALLMSYTIPASATPEGKARLSAYYEALGRFIDMFSQVETVLTLTLRKYARTSDEIAKVLFSNTSADQGAAFIRQLADVTGTAPELIADLDYVLLQFKFIKNARNEIMHHGAKEVAEGAAFVSNALKARGEPFVFPISPEILKAMTEDALKITYHLTYKHLESLPGGIGLVRAIIEQTLQAPWQYTHPERPKGSSKRDQSRKARKRAPKPRDQP